MEVTRRLIVGCEFVHESEADVSTVFQVEPLSDQKVDVIQERWSLEPDGPTRAYSDLYGNTCRRLIIPTGRSVINYRATVAVPDAVEAVDEQAPELTPDQLPDETLIYILPSRFCLPDVLGADAWERFGGTPPGYRRVQAICDTCMIIFSSNTVRAARGPLPPTFTPVVTGCAGTSPTWQFRYAVR